MCWVIINVQAFWWKNNSKLLQRKSNVDSFLFSLLYFSYYQRKLTSFQHDSRGKSTTSLQIPRITSRESEHVLNARALQVVYAMIQWFFSSIFIMYCYIKAKKSFQGLLTHVCTVGNKLNTAWKHKLCLPGWYRELGMLKVCKVCKVAGNLGSFLIVPEASAQCFCSKTGNFQTLRCTPNPVPY